MIVIKDSIVLIHLAKLSVIEDSCIYFGDVCIPQMVHKEVIRGKEKGYPDAKVIADLIKSEKIVVKKIRDRSLVKKANDFNIQRGEAEALALYWEENADFLATDDDNVRKKKNILDIKTIGTPVILLELFRKKKIDYDKFKLSLSELRNIGWFSNAVIDKVLMEAEDV